MKIPWKSLGSQPTVINIEKVYMLVAPVPDEEVLFPRCFLFLLNL